MARKAEYRRVLPAAAAGCLLTVLLLGGCSGADAEPVDISVVTEREEPPTETEPVFVTETEARTEKKTEPVTEAGSVTETASVTEPTKETETAEPLPVTGPETEPAPPETEKLTETEAPKEPEPKVTEAPKQPEPKVTEAPKQPEPKVTEAPKQPEPKVTEAPKQPEPKVTEAPKQPEPKVTEAPKKPEPKVTEAPKQPEPKVTEAPKKPEPKVTEAPKQEEKTMAVQKITLNENEIFASAAVTGLKLPSASGTAAEKTETAEIDYSNTAEGYIGVRYTAGGDKKRQLRVTAPNGVNYDYVLPVTGEWLYFPLSAGNGSYTATLYENVAGTKFAKLLGVTFDVKLKDEFSPFLYPNCYVNYSGASKAVKIAAYLAKSAKSQLETIQSVYNYIVTNITYDRKLASSVSSSYISDLENVMTVKSGICFDYAALMTAMLRSQGIPTKMVFGYSDKEYHAWVSVYTKETGWMNEVFKFSGTWKLLDPTAASTSKQSSAVNAYIEKADKYQPKFLY